MNRQEKPAREGLSDGRKYVTNKGTTNPVTSAVGQWSLSLVKEEGLAAAILHHDRIVGLHSKS